MSSAVGRASDWLFYVAWGMTMALALAAGVELGQVLLLLLAGRPVHW